MCMRYQQTHSSNNTEKGEKKDSSFFLNIIKYEGDKKKKCSLVLLLMMYPNTLQYVPIQLLQCCYYRCHQTMLLSS